MLKKAVFFVPTTRDFFCLDEYTLIIKWTSHWFY
ncbi:MAG: hypothetical protein RL708_1951 [Bacteroidota bacterium]|jgi:hypothetical protein